MLYKSCQRVALLPRRLSIQLRPLRAKWGGTTRTKCTVSAVVKRINLISNKMGDKVLSCTIHLPSSVMIRPVVFVLEC